MDNGLRKGFEDAGRQEQTGLASELWQLIKQNKKYWLIPIVIGLLLFGVLIILGGSAAAPFIYTIF